MKALVLSLSLALLVTFSIMPVAAEEMTLNGSVMCAKCKLKKADTKQCEDVLLVKSDTGETTEYYITKNPVVDKFGHTCGGETPAAVTGEVTEKDGKKWIAPSKMEKRG